MIAIRTVLAGALVLLGGCARAGSEPPQQPAPDSVSIGYGKQPRSDVTGAVQSVKPDSAAARYTTVVDLLEGRVPGLQVIRLASGQIQLRIRGTTSLIGNNEPLVIIDDQLIATDGITSALQAIAPSEVDHVDVLKDAGSTAIYGSRGANGVIMIFTKRGKP